MSYSQTTASTRQYDAFGMLVATTDKPQGPFGYQEDQDSGRKLLGHHYYDPSTARKNGRN